MVNLVLQQKNSGCAVLNGPGDECLTVPPGNSCSVFVVEPTFYWSYEKSRPMVWAFRATTHIVRQNLRTMCVSEAYLWLYKN